MLPVAIIGGGPVGLTSSILLSLQHTPNLLFERHPSTSIHPKACGLNQRTIEIFRAIGIEDEVLQSRAPRERSGRTAWYTSLGKRGREIYARDAWGGGEDAREYESMSPCPYVILPQIRLEPILKRRAMQLNPYGIHYRSEVTDVIERADHVVLKISQKTEDGAVSVEEQKASYVLVCDGGRKFTDELGIKWEGETNIVDMVTCHIRAPLSIYHPDPRNFITWFVNPALGGSIGSGYLYHVGPYPSPPEKEEWVFAFAMRADDPERFDEGECSRRLRRSVGVEGLEVSILSLSHWYVNSVVAERYRSEGGRVFLVGDAAHRVPPWGALGLNTGIQDAYNLIWKLSFGLKRGSAGDKLLDSYEVERRPIAKRVADNSLSNLRSHGLVMDAALGVGMEKSAEENQTALKSYFDETDEGHKQKREAVRHAQSLLDAEFKAPGIEMGWFYPSADTNKEGEKTRHGGQVLLDERFNVLEYIPSTIPGHSLPHVWLEKDEKKVSTRDLIRLDQYVLLANSDAWRAAESELIHVEVIGKEGWTDIDGSWKSVPSDVEDGGVLVRPDGIVAWRKNGFEDSDVDRLSSFGR